MQELDWQSKSKIQFWFWIVNHNPIKQYPVHNTVRFFILGRIIHSLFLLTMFKNDVFPHDPKALRTLPKTSFHWKELHFICLNFNWEIFFSICVILARWFMTFTSSCLFITHFKKRDSHNIVIPVPWKCVIIYDVSFGLDIAKDPHPQYKK